VQKPAGSELVNWIKQRYGVFRAIERCEDVVNGKVYSRIMEYRCIGIKQCIESLAKNIYKSY
jgi:hypothetical protein